MSFFEVLFLLIVGHFLADYPLQGDFISKAKNPMNPVTGVPWMWPMVAHCTIHSAFVYVITGNWILAVGEFIMHFYIDVKKCYFHIDFNEDQVLHIICKIVWVSALFILPLV